MKIAAVLLIIIGIAGLLISTLMFGDIGVAAAIASVVGLVSGFGFLSAAKSLKVESR